MLDIDIDTEFEQALKDAYNGKIIPFSVYAIYAVKGCASAEYCLADCYRKGKGGCKTPNPELAFDWYLSAANKGHVAAMNQVAKYYFDQQKNKNDIEIEKNAIVWFTKAAERGHKYAMRFLSDWYQKNDRPKDAIVWLKKSAEAGNPLSQFELSNAYFHGRFVEQDFNKMFEWCYKSAQTGYTDAQYMLGMHYIHGNGTEVNHNKAFSCFQKAAYHGQGIHLKALRELGICYLTGKGTPIDVEKAFHIFMKCVDKNQLDAFVDLGYMYFQGLHVDKDLYTAFNLFKHAAKAKHPIGLYFVGLYHYHGYMFTRDYQKAYSYFLHSVDHGYSLAACKVAKCLRTGTGIKKDPVTAIEWYKRFMEFPPHDIPFNKVCSVAYQGIADCYTEMNEPVLAAEYTRISFEFATKAG